MIICINFEKTKEKRRYGFDWHKNGRDTRN